MSNIWAAKCQYICLSCLVCIYALIIIRPIFPWGILAFLCSDVCTLRTFHASVGKYFKTCKHWNMSIKYSFHLSYGSTYIFFCFLCTAFWFNVYTLHMFSEETLKMFRTNNEQFIECKGTLSILNWKSLSSNYNLMKLTIFCCHCYSGYICQQRSSCVQSILRVGSFNIKQGSYFSFKLG